MNESVEPFSFGEDLNLGASLPRPVAALAIVAVVVEVVISLMLAATVKVPLWLDETLTVNIASRPLADLPSVLRHDGAPPLFYALLHVWMGIFGQSSFSVRMLPACISALTLLATFFIVKRIWTQSIAVMTIAILAGAPYFVYYSSECRMYVLVMLESVLLLGALEWAITAPTRKHLAAVALCVAALLYTHYWSIYLLMLVFCWVAHFALFGQNRNSARRTLGAMVFGGIAFLPWVPVFLFQLGHTGTPWSGAQPISVVVEIFAWFSFNQAALFQVPSLHSQLLIVGYLATGAIGLFGIATGRFTLMFDLRIQRRARLVAIWSVGTVIIGSFISMLSASAVVTRYASVAFIPFVILMALGVASFGEPWVRLLLVVGLGGVGLWSANQYHGTARTESPRIASALEQFAQPGDVVAFCPDQLAPSTLRLLPLEQKLHVKAIGYPHFDRNPTIIDWIDYEEAIRAADPLQFAKRLDVLAGPSHRVWLVSQPYAPGLHGKCIDLRSALNTVRPGVSKVVVAVDLHRYWMPMQLTVFPSARSDKIATVR